MRSSTRWSTSPRGSPTGRRVVDGSAQSGDDDFRGYPRTTLAVVDGAGHALPHEKLLRSLVTEWLQQVESPSA